MGTTDRLDREQLTRDCSDAPESLGALAASLADLGPALSRSRSAHASRTTIIWHLIQVLEKLEKGVE
jgi:hypothetical protein